MQEMNMQWDQILHICETAAHFYHAVHFIYKYYVAYLSSS